MLQLMVLVIKLLRNRSLKHIFFLNVSRTFILSLTFSPTPISFCFFNCILKDKISGSGKLRSLILCPPDKSKAGLYYISGIGDHSVLWSLFACSQKCFDFVKGANNSCNLFPQSCFPVILQLFLTVGSKYEFQLACSSSACPLCRQSSV